MVCKRLTPLVNTLAFTAARILCEGLIPGRHRGTGGAARRALRWATPCAGPLAREGRGQHVRGQAMRSRGACQTVGQSARVQAAPPSRLPNAMVARACRSLITACPAEYKDA